MLGGKHTATARTRTRRAGRIGALTCVLMATVFSVPAAADNPSLEDLIRMNQELMQRNQALMEQNEALMNQNNVLVDEVKANSARIQDLEVYQTTPPPGGVVAAGYAPSGIGQAPNGQTPQNGVQPAAAHQGQGADPEEDLFIKRGHFPGSYQIPGTEGATSDGKGFAFKVGGFAKLDIINSFKDIGAGAEDLGNVTAIPTRSTQVPDGDKVNIHARESRFNFDVRGRTKIGLVRGFIEGDFFGGGSEAGELTANSEVFRLRHAFVQMGNALAGQTWSTYSNPTAYPETLDFRTPGPQTFIRQGQFRWTQPLDMIDPNASIAFAVENPESQVFEDGSSNQPKNEVPEFILRGKYAASWGSLQAATVLRDIPADTEDEEVFGYGVHVSGRLLIPWLKQGEQQDDFRFEMNYGDGIGRFIQDVASASFGTAGGAAQVNPVNGELETITAFGGYGSYRHWWLENLRSSFMGGYVEVQNEDFRPDDQLNKTVFGRANLIWSPIPAVDTGVEFGYGLREDADGLFGEATRVQFSTKYKF